MRKLKFKSDIVKSSNKPIFYKFFDVPTSETDNYNTHIAQYLKE